MGGIEAIENKNIAGILGPCVCCVATCDNLSSKVMSVAFRGRGVDYSSEKRKNVHILCPCDHCVAVVTIHHQKWCLQHVDVEVRIFLCNHTSTLFQYSNSSLHQCYKKIGMSDLPGECPQPCLCSVRWKFLVGLNERRDTYPVTLPPALFDIATHGLPWPPLQRSLVSSYSSGIVLLSSGNKDKYRKNANMIYSHPFCSSLSEELYTSSTLRGTMGTERNLEYTCLVLRVAYLSHHVVLRKGTV